MLSTLQRQNLSVFWKLDDDTTPTADASGNSNSGVVTTATTIQGGRFGKARNFNSGGTDKIISTNNVTLGTSAFTIILWFRKSSDATSRGMIATDATNTAEVFISVRWSDAATNKITFYTIVAGGANTPATTRNTYGDGKWHQLICTRDASGVNRVYVDGNFEGVSTALTDSLTAAKIRIGNREGGTIPQESAANSFKGDLDEFALYIGEAFSAGKIRRLYNNFKFARTF